MSALLIGILLQFKFLITNSVTDTTSTTSHTSSNSFTTISSGTGSSSTEEITCRLEDYRGFLRYVCRTYKSGKLWDKTIKCHNSGEWFGEPMEAANIGAKPKLIFDHFCKNDSQSYQACGFPRKQGPFRSLENATCQYQVIMEKYRGREKVWAEIVEVKSTLSNKTVTLPTGKIALQDNICDDKCDVDCEDEASCNGFMYGKYCPNQRDPGKKLVYIKPYEVCTNYHEWICCEHLRDMAFLPWVERKECVDMMMCNPKHGEEKNLCEMPARTASRLSHGAFPLVTVQNFTRCTPNTICKNFVDQFNCTDKARVGMTCQINGELTTISKYRICEDNRRSFCDDEIDTKCEKVSPSCTVHKHSLCNTEMDCEDGVDEKMSICQLQTLKTCVRRGGNGTASLQIPLAWLNDGTIDCMDGTDEEDGWPTCGLGVNRRLAIEDNVCKNVFLCKASETKFVELENLCDGIDVCGNENKMCREARDSKAVTVHTEDQGLQKRISYCLPGLKQLQKLAYLCVQEEFVFPENDIYGLTVPRILLPNTSTNCDHMFGEQYVYSSCTHKCMNSHCPLKNIPKYYSCPGQYTVARAGTIMDNGNLTFAVKSQGANSSVYNNEIFICDNGIKCVPYSKVCDLVDDCGDGSDEERCTNHYKCTTTGQYVPKTSFCNGKIDCLDLSDECNADCSVEILNGLALKGASWTIGSIAVVANLWIVIRNFSTLKKCRTTVALTNKSLVLMISLGDLLIGSYLLTVSLFDGLLVKENYCTNQIAWIASTECPVLGVVSTIGSQISLFAMTVLSVVRLHGIWRSMRIPGEVNLKNSVKVLTLNLVILLLSACVAVFPILGQFEDFFVNEMEYDTDLNLFIGMVNKDTHFRVLETYFGRMKGQILSWDLTDDMVSEMFTHDPGVVDFTKTKTKVGFYGNDAVCLFKYFIRKSDPQSAFVWSILALNFCCFVFISVCYINISIFSTRSSKRVIMRRNKEVNQRNRRMNQRVTIIILSDFACWVPFIVICILHYAEVFDATSWYSVLSMIILPINSVINPLLYDNVITEKAQSLLSRTYASIHSFTSTIRGSVYRQDGGTQHKAGKRETSL